MKLIRPYLTALLLALMLTLAPLTARSAISVSETQYGPGIKLLTVSGITAVGAATKGSVETINLSSYLGGSEATSSRLIGVQISTTTSTDFDAVIGTADDIDVQATTDYYKCVWIVSGVNIGTFDFFENDPRPLVDTDGKAYIRIKNDDSGNATGAITLILWVRY